MIFHSVNLGVILSCFFMMSITAKNCFEINMSLIKSTLTIKYDRFL